VRQRRPRSAAQEEATPHHPAVAVVSVEQSQQQQQQQQQQPTNAPNSGHLVGGSGAFNPAAGVLLGRGREADAAFAMALDAYQRRASEDSAAGLRGGLTGGIDELQVWFGSLHLFRCVRGLCSAVFARLVGIGICCDPPCWPVATMTSNAAGFVLFGVMAVGWRVIFVGQLSRVRFSLSVVNVVNV